MASNQDTLHADLGELLTILGMGDHARPQSPHEVFQEALGVLREKLAPMITIEMLKDVAEKQFAYWRERMRAEKCLEDGISEDGETYTPIGDVAAWQGGYCNGRMGEAEWWIGTLRALAATPPEARQTETGWPAGCIKPNACARHRACMYAQSAEQCRHFGQDLTAAVEAASTTQESGR